MNIERTVNVTIELNGEEARLLESVATIAERVAYDKIKGYYRTDYMHGVAPPICAPSEFADQVMSLAIELAKALHQERVEGE